ncbi:MAG: peptidylprolyl isomerase, partial [Verrucomicrobiota bacterium]|nr:peptidylprolyl isomerase [Verrucomicrobiota bacterium]
NGGELGWLQRGRVPEDLQDALFSAAPGTPVLVRSRMGWHLLEVLERKAARKRDFVEARREVLAALEAVKRRDGLREYRKGLRQREQNHIEVFLDVLERGL